MNKEELSFFVGKTIKINCQFSDLADSMVLFYTGVVLAVTDNSLHLRDKFGKLIIVDLTTIKGIQEI